MVVCYLFSDLIYLWWWSISSSNLDKLSCLVHVLNLASELRKVGRKDPRWSGPELEQPRCGPSTRPRWLPDVGPICCDRIDTRLAFSASLFAAVPSSDAVPPIFLCRWDASRALQGFQSCGRSPTTHNSWKRAEVEIFFLLAVTTLHLPFLFSAICRAGLHPRKAHSIPFLPWPVTTIPSRGWCCRRGAPSLSRSVAPWPGRGELRNQTGPGAVWGPVC